MLMKMRDMKKGKNYQKGFTLIELIVVMAILAVLAAIAVPRYSTILSDTKTKANATTVTMIENAADLYIANQAAAGTTVSTLTTAQLVTANYLKGNNIGKTDVVGPANQTYTIAISGSNVTVTTVPAP